MICIAGGWRVLIFQQIQYGPAILMCDAIKMYITVQSVWIMQKEFLLEVKAKRRILFAQTWHFEQLCILIVAFVMIVIFSTGDSFNPPKNMTFPLKQKNYYAWVAVQLVQVHSYPISISFHLHCSIMNSEEDKHIYGDPDKVVQFMDYSENPVQDNSHYIPDLVPGIL